MERRCTMVWRHVPHFSIKICGSLLPRFPTIPDCTEDNSRPSCAGLPPKDWDLKLPNGERGGLKSQSSAGLLDAGENLSRMHFKIRYSCAKAGSMEVRFFVSFEV